MQYNVAQLLLEPTGSTRSFSVERSLEPSFEEPPDSPQEVEGSRGSVRMLRTHRGILVRAWLDVESSLNCSRCLADYRRASSLDFEEEFIPVVDLATGKTIAGDLEDNGFFRIGGDHILDLNEAVRQYAIVDQPMKPLCNENCSGLCHWCGSNLNLGPCGCRGDAIDPRWGALAGLLFPEED